MSCDWLMIDGPSLIFRAYYGTLSRGRTGAPASGSDAGSAIPSFLARLARAIEQRRPRRVAVAEDRAWRPDWRVQLIPSYKSHRVAEPVPPPLAPQIPVIYSILAAVGIDTVGADDYEAEDVIATLSRLAGGRGRVEILSGDRDLFALVRGDRVRVLYPERGGYAVIDEQEVARRYEVPGHRYGDFAVLRGDPSDGLPGLRGVGSVGAAGMIRRHGSIEGVLRERSLAEADREYLTRAAQVVRPVEDVPIALPAGRRPAYPVDEAALEALLAAHRAQAAGHQLLGALDAMVSHGREA